MIFIHTILAFVCTAFVGLNLWLMASGMGGPLNAIAAAVCVFSAVMNTALALRR